jgi:hypothetical protein
MAHKKLLSVEERYNLTEEQIYEAERYLRNAHTAGAMSAQDSTRQYEMRLLGYSYEEIQKQYPNIPMGKLLLTSAINGWERDAQILGSTILDRVRGRLVRSTVEQIDMLTNMISVFNLETSREMEAYLKDPKKAPKPKNGINNIKDLKETVTMLAQIAETVKGLANNEPVQTKKKTKVLESFSKIAEGRSEESCLLAELVGDKSE